MGATGWRGRERQRALIQAQSDRSEEEMVLRPRWPPGGAGAWRGGGCVFPSLSDSQALGLGLPGPKVVVVAAAAGWGRLGLCIRHQAGRQERGGLG